MIDVMNTQLRTRDYRAVEQRRRGLLKKRRNAAGSGNPGDYGSSSWLLAFCLLSQLSTTALGQLCACTPSVYTVELDFAKTCADTTISVSTPGVIDVQCSINPIVMGSVDDVIAFQVQIMELDQNLQVLGSGTTIFNTFRNGDTITFESVIADPNASTDRVPSSLEVGIMAEDATMSRIFQTWTIAFSNSCEIYPVLTVGQQIGWTMMSQLQPPPTAFCPLAAGSPTIAPAPTGPVPPPIPSTPAPGVPTAKPKSTKGPTRRPATEPTPQPTLPPSECPHWYRYYPKSSKKGKKSKKSSKSKSGWGKGKGSYEYEISNIFTDHDGDDYICKYPKSSKSSKKSKSSKGKGKGYYYGKGKGKGYYPDYPPAQPTVHKSLPPSTKPPPPPPYSPGPPTHSPLRPPTKPPSRVSMDSQDTADNNMIAELPDYPRDSTGGSSSTWNPPKTNQQSSSEGTSTTTTTSNAGGSYAGYEDNGKNAAMMSGIVIGGVVVVLFFVALVTRFRHDSDKDYLIKQQHPGDAMSTAPTVTTTSGRNILSAPSGGASTCCYTTNGDSPPTSFSRLEEAQPVHSDNCNGRIAENHNMESANSQYRQEDPHGLCLGGDDDGGEDYDEDMISQSPSRSSYNNIQTVDSEIS